MGGLEGWRVGDNVIADTLPLFSHLKKKKLGPSRMSPKAQRPLRGGAKTLSSPSSRPSGEASVAPPPAGKIPAVFYGELETRGELEVSVVGVLGWETALK